MPNIYELVDGIFDHSVFRPQLIGGVCYSSFPILIQTESEILLSLFTYNLDFKQYITQPSYHFLVSLKSPNNIEAIPIVKPGDIGFNIDFSQSRAHMIHPLNKPRPNFIITYEKICGTVDQLINFYPKNPPLLTESERSVVEEYANLFNTYAEDLLIPAYRFVSPDFFEWLQEVLQGTSTSLHVDPHFALRKMHAFNQLVILPVFNEIKATLEQDNKEVMIISGSSTGDDELDKNLQGMHPNGHWLGGTEYYFSDAVDLCTQQFIGPTLIAQDTTASAFRPKNSHPDAGKFFHSIIYTVGEKDVIYAAPMVMHYMQFDQKFHRFLHRFDPAIEQHQLEYITRAQVLQHSLDSLTFYELYAQSETSPF